MVRKKSTKSRKLRLEPCNVCHKAVDISKPCMQMRPYCPDCGFRPPVVYVFCSQACAQRWNPPDSASWMFTHPCAAGRA